MASTTSEDGTVTSGSRTLKSLRDLPWPPLLVLLALASPGWALDERYRMLPTPVSISLAVIAVVLVATCFVARIRHNRKLERLTIVILAEGGTIANTGLLLSLLWMMANTHDLDGRRLLSSAVFVWLSNVLVFSLAYWAMDRGGPEERHLGTPRKADFIFPEMQEADVAEEPFEPNFGDYLYLGFSTSTAFSATDTLTGSTRARLMVVAQASISLITIAVVAARAVNILPSGQ